MVNTTTNYLKSVTSFFFFGKLEKNKKKKKRKRRRESVYLKRGYCTIKFLINRMLKDIHFPFSPISKILLLTISFFPNSPKFPFPSSTLDLA